MKISRKELYDAVWGKPVRTLAREWGLSDVGLAKACRKHEIPLPTVGHWAKVAVGRGVSKPPLAGNPDAVLAFSGAPSLKKPLLSEQIQQGLSPALEVTQLLTGETQAPKLARWARKTEIALNKQRANNGFISANKETFRVSISKGTQERVIRILNILETALSRAGIAWEIDEKRGYIVGQMFGEFLPLEISEKYSRTEHIDRHPEHRWLDKKTYTYRFLGELTVRIDGWYEGRKSWSDGKTKRLEEKLPEIVEGFLAAAEALRRRTVEREEQAKRWAEEERVRAEKARIAREEKALLDATIKDANDWAQANTIREYAAHIRRTLVEQRIQLSDEGHRWLLGIEESAEKLDPLHRYLKA